MMTRIFLCEIGLPFCADTARTDTRCSPGVRLEKEIRFFRVGGVHFRLFNFHEYRINSDAS